MGLADVFRAEWPRLVATLMRDVGDLTIAEDAAQDAFIEASTRWPTDGVPDRAGAWLVTTGRRKAIDQIRRMKRFEDRLPALTDRLIRANFGNRSPPPIMMSAQPGGPRSDRLMTAISLSSSTRSAHS
jgi:RNA polymerase sigma-70 factor (ECF subfamily)